MDAYSYWGNALQELGRFEEAKKAYQDGLKQVVRKEAGESKKKIKKEDSEKAGMLYFHLASAHSNLGDTDKALKAYKVCHNFLFVDLSCPSLFPYPLCPHSLPKVRACMRTCVHTFVFCR